MKRVLIIAGGTGGHIFPALAVARALQQQGIEVHWLGTRGGLETKLVPGEFPLETVAITGLRGKGWRRYLLLPFALLRATWQTWHIMRRFKPDVVLGMGGYVAAPGGVAAWLTGTPLVIHEQNAIAGLTNRVLAKIAKSVLQAFPDTFPEKANVVTSGNPVRAELAAAPLPQQRFADRDGPLRILVLGGSQGAHAINQQMLAVLRDFSPSEDVTVWHQTGERDYDEVKRACSDIPVSIKVEAFINDMATAYCWADLVICRAGALTVSEVAAVGVASIFIPFPYAVDNHQLHNSRFLEQAGAAIIIVQQFLTKKRLLELLEKFSHERNRLLTMADCARSLAQPQAVEHVIAECQKVGHVRK